jgi:hypothetical protein
MIGTSEGGGVTIVRTATLTALFLSLALLTSTAFAQPSLGAAEADFSAGNYRACLQKISQMLGGKLAPGGSKQRYDLLMLRGECQLNLKNRDLAVDAFEAASRVTFAKEDITPTANAKAIALLIERSPELRYKPKGKPDGDGIDIVTPNSRKTAMTALLDELLPAAQSAADAAGKATDVAVMHEALEPIADAFVVELTMTGEPKRSAPTFRQVGSHVRTLIAGEVERLQHRAEQLSVQAGEPKDAGAESPGAERRGLTADERGELAKAEDQIDSLRLAAQHGRRIARRLGSTGENWDTIVADCTELRDLIRQTLAGAR